MHQSACVLYTMRRTVHTVQQRRTSVEGDDKISGLVFHDLIVNIAGGCHKQSGKKVPEENNTRRLVTLAVLANAR